MSERTGRYADAIVALARAEGALDTVERELLTIAQAVEDHRELRDRLTDVQTPVGARMRFVESEALGAASRATRAALAAVVAADRGGDLLDIARQVAERAAAGRDRELAEVYVAEELSDERREALRRALERATGKDLDLKVFVDESLIGGVRAKVGDTVIDGSVARRLDDIRTRLTS